MALCAAMIGAAGAWNIPAARSSGSVTFVVNTTGDSDDAAPNGICQTQNAGECTLRAALTEARVSTLPIEIDFAIAGSGVHTISVSTPLPSIDNVNAPVVVDGMTQPGSVPNVDPLAMTATFGIEIAGPGGSTINGLTIASPSNVIRGVDVHGFRKQMYLTGPNAANNTIVGDIVGLTPTGEFDANFALNPGSSCVELIKGAHGNHIGVPGDANRNVVSGCDQKGIALYNPGTANNWIQNNIIGLDPTGTQRRGTKSHGVDINSWSTSTTVGGLGWEERNVISGNNQSGVEISHGAGTEYHAVIGNFIGTDLSGTTFSPATVNGQIGVRLEGKPSCAGVCTADEGFETVTDNIIVNSTLAGVYVDKGVHDSLIARNLIGVLPDGTAAPNVRFGVRIEAGATRITVANNRIAFNGHGVQIAATGAMPANSTESPTRSIELTGNLIYSNGGGLPIDLAPWGVANDVGHGDANVNDDMRVPVLSMATSNSVQVTTCSGCTVELFEATATGSYGGAIALLGSATADAAGTVVMSFPTASVTRKATSVAINAQRSSSEFARNVTVPAAH